MFRFLPEHVLVMRDALLHFSYPFRTFGWRQIHDKFILFFLKCLRAVAAPTIHKLVATGEINKLLKVIHTLSHFWRVFRAHEAIEADCAAQIVWAKSTSRIRAVHSSSMRFIYYPIGSAVSLQRKGSGRAPKFWLANAQGSNTTPLTTGRPTIQSRQQSMLWKISISNSRAILNT